MSALDQGPLSDAEIDELDRFLLDAEGIDESMDIATLDGFLTASLPARSRRSAFCNS